MVEHLFSALVGFSPDIKVDCIVKGLEENKAVIEEKIEETKGYINPSFSTHEINVFE